jgi:hypothetical protein
MRLWLYCDGWRDYWDIAYARRRVGCLGIRIWTKMQRRPSHSLSLSQSSSYSGILKASGPSIISFYRLVAGAHSRSGVSGNSSRPSFAKRFLFAPTQALASRDFETLKRLSSSRFTRTLHSSIETSLVWSGSFRTQPDRSVPSSFLISTISFRMVANSSRVILAVPLSVALSKYIQPRESK